MKYKARIQSLKDKLTNFTVVENNSTCTGTQIIQTALEEIDVQATA